MPPDVIIARECAERRSIAREDNRGVGRIPPGLRQRKTAVENFERKEQD
jgi:hypothetical protein